MAKVVLTSEGAYYGIRNCCFSNRYSRYRYNEIDVAPRIILESTKEPGIAGFFLHLRPDSGFRQVYGVCRQSAFAINPAEAKATTILHQTDNSRVAALKIAAIATTNLCKSKSKI